LMRRVMPKRNALLGGSHSTPCGCA
jgi:hypothetical protein